ncbi:MAG: translation initiation factor IF-2 [Opitutaceae bacterium]|nr:translation initiation factor IF-2 [Opitutaceae bacterium]
MNKLLFDYLKERSGEPGWPQVASPSSTIPNYFADDLVAELSPAPSETPAPVATPEPAQQEPSGGVHIPEGVHVKTVEEVARDKETAIREKEKAAEEAKKVAQAAAAPVPPPAQRHISAPPPPPRAVSAPPPAPAIVSAPKPAPSAPPPLPPPSAISAPKPPPVTPTAPIGAGQAVKRSPIPAVRTAADVAAAAAAAAAAAEARKAQQRAASAQRPAPAPASRPAPSSSPASTPRSAPATRPAPAPAPRGAPGQRSASSPPPAPRPAPHAPVSRPSAPPPPPVASAPKPPPAIVSAPIAPPSIPSSAPFVITSVPAAGGEVRMISMKPPIIVRDFAPALGLKPFKLISELMAMGVFASMNQTVDETVAVKVAEKFGFLLEIKHRGDAAQQQAKLAEKAKKKKDPNVDDPKDLVPRPPVVCILGHVDHGKTSLLDAIRKAHVAAGEHGGITQHIGAYQVTRNDRKITFLDTPGHAAFNKMRERGASVTDIAVLVVAADDGFMPQTDEALQHAQNAKVALIVAINKIDAKGANIDMIKGQMQQRNIAPEDWGGETITVPVSALKGDGVDDLLEMIALQADVLELKANPKAPASGVIIESQIDTGRGPLATVIVQRGTLRVGDAVVCGQHWAKVRAMFDDQGNNVKEAPPSTPVRVIGWSGAPDSGAEFKTVKNAREAENIAEEEHHRLRQIASTQAAEPKESSIESLFASIAATQQKVLKVIIKTDVFGSAEAVRHVLEGIKSTKVSLEIVSTDVGLIGKNDVLMAGTGGAVILGFNTKLENGVTPLAKHHGVRIETFNIIYELGDKVREMMADLLDPELKEAKLGAAEVRATFPLAKGFVAGCLVTEGKITRNAQSRLRRGKAVVTEGKVNTLKRFKDDANEVRAGLECGIKLDDFSGYEIGDVIECYEIQKVRASL